MNVFSKHFINPFDQALEKDSLINVSSGVPVQDDVAKYILTIPEAGARSFEEFRKDRMLPSKNVDFHNPIRRKKILLFGQNNKRATIAKNNKSKTIEVNRDILAKLLSISVHKERMIDFEIALQYPLATVPLSLSSVDGTMRKTNKSELAKAILANATNEEAPTSILGVTVYIVDLMALIRTLRDIPEKHLKILRLKL